MKKGPFTVLSSKTIYKNRWIEVQEDKVTRPDGTDGIFGTVDNGTGVSVVALDKDNQIHLIKEYYYVLEEYGIQTPSGAIEKGQTTLDAAKQELLEETGLSAQKWTKLGYTNALTMIIKAPSYLFLAQEIAQQGKPESGIEVMTMPFENAYQMVLDSQITHAPSCLAIMKAKVLLDNE